MSTLEAIAWAVAGGTALGGLRLWWSVRPRKGVRHRGGLPIGERQRKEARRREWRENANRRRRKR